MTNEHNKKPNVAESVASSVKRLEERIGTSEVRINHWLNELEGNLRLFVQGVSDRLIAKDEAHEDEDEDEDEE